MASLTDIIKKPLVTEKCSLATKNENVYGFVVGARFRKGQIKEAVQKLYNVEVLRVRTAIIPGKLKRVRRVVSKSSSFKKAYVKIKEGQTIEQFDKA